MGAQKSTNNQGAQKVCPECPLGDGVGEADLAEFNGAVFSSRAVPGAEIWHLEKM